MFTIVQKYLIKQFLMTLFFALIALSLIFVIVDMLENLDDFIDQKASIFLILKYYLYFLPEILKLMIPIGVLLATLFTIGRLSTLNEITAMKACGISLYKILTPFVILSLLISFLHLYFNGWIVPKATIVKTEIDNKFLKKGSTNNQIYNLYFRDSPTRNLVMQYYDSENKTGSSVSIEQYSSESNPRLINRLEANKISWDEKNNYWKLYNIIQRNYSGIGLQTLKSDSLTIKLKITHNQVVELKKSTKEMTYSELNSYIHLVEKGGKDIRKQLIEYYGNFAFPFANLIVVLFGVPFASIKKKGGIAIQIGSAMVISFFYIIFTKIGQTIGYAGNYDAILSAWLANIIFFIVSLVILFRTRT